MATAPIINDHTATTSSKFNIRGSFRPDALVLHHTVGNPDENGIVSIFQETNHPTHFFIDREGGIHQILALDQRGSHVRYQPDSVTGITNTNAWGVEISAENDDDVTDAQAAAAVRLVQYLQQTQGLSVDRVFTHGQTDTTNKLSNEGSKAYDAIQAALNPGATPYPESRENMRVARGENPALDAIEGASPSDPRNPDGPLTAYNDSPQQPQTPLSLADALAQRGMQNQPQFSNDSLFNPPQQSAPRGMLNADMPRRPSIDPRTSQPRVGPDGTNAEQGLASLLQRRDARNTPPQDLIGTSFQRIADANQQPRTPYQQGRTGMPNADMPRRASVTGPRLRNAPPDLISTSNQRIAEANPRRPNNVPPNPSLPPVGNYSGPTSRPNNAPPPLPQVSRGPTSRPNNSSPSLPPFTREQQQAGNTALPREAGDRFSEQNRLAGMQDATNNGTYPTQFDLRRFNGQPSRLLPSPSSPNGSGAGSYADMATQFRTPPPLPRARPTPPVESPSYYQQGYGSQSTRPTPPPGNPFAAPEGYAPTPAPRIQRPPTPAPYPAALRAPTPAPPIQRVPTPMPPQMSGIGSGASLGDLYAFGGAPIPMPPLQRAPAQIPQQPPPASGGAMDYIAPLVAAAQNPQFTFENLQPLGQPQGAQQPQQRMVMTRQGMRPVGSKSNGRTVSQNDWFNRVTGI